jgi:hypothetical protein
VSINAISLAAGQLDIRVGGGNNATCGVVIAFNTKSFVELVTIESVNLPQSVGNSHSN